MPLAAGVAGAVHGAVTVFGSRPMFSMMSISPELGHGLVPMSLPSIQKAGQMPWPRGILMRASNRPYVWANLSGGQDAARGVLAAAVVALVVGGFSRRAVITRLPLRRRARRCWSVGVVLPLVVAPAAAADVELPLGWSIGRAGRPLNSSGPGDRADGGVGGVVAGGGEQTSGERDRDGRRGQQRSWSCAWGCLRGRGVNTVSSVYRSTAVSQGRLVPEPPDDAFSSNSGLNRWAARAAPSPGSEVCGASTS